MSNHRTKSKTAALIILAWCVIFSAYAAAQTQKPNAAELQKKKNAAENLFKEGKDLFDRQTLETHRQAREKFLAAADLYRETGDKSGEGQSLVGAAFVSNNLGEKQVALGFYVRALPLFEVIADDYWHGLTLNNIAGIYDDVGEKQKALEFYDKSLPLIRRAGDKSLEASVTSNIGDIYTDLGENQKALEFFTQSLTLARAAADNITEAQTLNNIGMAFYGLDEKRRALGFFEQAFEIYKAAGHKLGEALTLANIGLIYRKLGENQKALEYFGKALPINREIGDKSGEATTLNNMAGVYDALGEKQKALDHYNQALPILRQIEYKTGEAALLENVMHLWNSLNNPKLAGFYGKQSVNVYQQLRANIKGLDKETQKTYLKSIEVTYRGLADILISQGRIAEAEQILGMLKEEEYLSYLRRDDSVAADLKGRISLSADEKKAFEDYEKFSGEITQTAKDFGALESKKNALALGETLSAKDQKQYDDLKAKYDAAITVFNKYLDDLKVKFSENDKRVASVESDTQGLLKKLNQPHTVIISTIVGEDNLNLILTTSDIQKAHTVDIKAADLNKLVAEFRDAVRDPKVDPRHLGKQLYDKLFPAAIVKDLNNIKADTIVWSLDGTLRYVPMAALFDGEKYLVERYTNAVLTLASRDKLSADTADRSKWLVFGVGVSREFEGFNALPAVPSELCSVVDDPKKKEFCNNFGSNGVFGGLLLPDDEFTLKSFQNNLGKTAIVHIASHFSLNAGNETDSYLLLGGGDDRRFSLDALKKTRLDNVELLTLSACNTAMSSGANSSGVEIEGFGAMAQKQGAKTVLATLWAVADDSTSILMSGFYKILETERQTGKAEALRKAQMVLLKGKSGADESTSSEKRSKTREIAGTSGKQPPFTPDKDAPFAHPYFWSPFILIGNWK